MVLCKQYYVYLLTNWNHRVMYVGVTNDLKRRLYEHKNKLVEGFPEKYNLNKFICISPEANLPRRQWPLENFVLIIKFLKDPTGEFYSQKPCF